MLIVSRGYYSLTYLFSYLLIGRRYRVPTQLVLGLGLEGCGLDSKSEEP